MLSPQKERILEILRDKQWHCSSEFGYIKDDRKRISELNEGYMKAKGWEIVGKPCDGRCGRTHSSGLFMRRAQKLGVSLVNAEITPSPQTLSEEMVKWFESLPSIA